MLDEYYTERGWDLKTGVPRRETLEGLGLSKAASELGKIK
jgi:aldehyde:ferredoxin oxidoreductase